MRSKYRLHVETYPYIYTGNGYFLDSVAVDKVPDRRIKVLHVPTQQIRVDSRDRAFQDHVATELNQGYVVGDFLWRSSDDRQPPISSK